MGAMLIQTEPTPNPATLKFLPGETVMTAGTRDFATPEDAEVSPLAEAIFSLGDVEGLFFGRDFISVTAAPGVEWPFLKPQVLAILLDHFSSGAPLFRPGTAHGIMVPSEDIASDDPADADGERRLTGLECRNPEAGDGAVGEVAQALDVTIL